MLDRVLEKVDTAVRIAPLALAPALILLGGLAIGIVAGDSSPDPKPLWGLLLVAAGVALGRRAGSTVLAAAVGYLLVSAGSEDLPTRGLIVEARVRVAGPWRSGSADSVRATVHLLSWSQLYPVDRWGGFGGRAEREVALEMPSGAAGLPSHFQLGAILRVRGEFRRPARFDNRNPVVVGVDRLVVKSLQWVELERRPGARSRWLYRLRHEIDRRLPPTDESRSPGLALARALTLGDGRGLSTETWRALRQAGLAHLIAVSGFNVAVLVAALWFLAWVVGVRRRGRYLVAVLGALVYLWVLGDQPSAARATCSAVLFAGALALGRLPWGPQILGLVGLGLLLADSRWLFDLSFQLTFAATAGLMLGAPPIGRALLARGARPVFAQGLAAGVAAQVATLPWILGEFHTWVGGGLLWNSLAAPWSVGAFLASFAAIGLRGWSTWLDDGVRAALDLVAWPLGRLGQATPIWGTYPWGGGPAWAWGIGIALALSLWLPVRGWVRASLVLAAVAVGIGVGLAAGSHREVRAVFFDVGQGDATLLQGGATVLVDGGGWPEGDFGGRVLIPALIAEGVTRVDAVVLSHFDRDHCQGLLDLAAWIQIDDVWTGPSWERSVCARELRARARRRAGTLVAGDLLAYGVWRLEVLSPDLRDVGRLDPGSNDGSVAILAEAAGRRLALLGDLEAKGERWLAFRAGSRVQADLLKVAHHGSASSTSERMLDLIQPRLAIVSSGRGNSFGHPAPLVVNRLRARGIHTLRTDRSGQVVLDLTSDSGDRRVWRLDLPGPIVVDTAAGH